MAEPCRDPARELLAEAALELLAEPERGEVLAHAAACPACRAELDDLVRVTDRVLALAPGAEPPAGFERRVLAALPASPGGRGARRRRRWRPTPAVAVAGAAVAAVVGAVALAVLAAAGGGGDGDLARAPLRTADGEVVGDVLLAGEDARAVVVRLDRYREGADYTCELVLAGGDVVDVGSWSPDGGDGGGAWWWAAAARVDGDVVAARMVVADGTVWATATLE